MLAKPTRPIRDSGLKLLVDADYLSYVCPAMTQHWEADEDLEPKELSDGRIVYVEDEESVTHLLRCEINGLKDRFETDDMEVFITPKEGNFRVDLATVKPYKGQRTAAKPYYHHLVRDLLVSEYGATMAEGMEADDAVATRHCEENEAGNYDTLIVSQDHDLKTVPGMLYVPHNNTLMYKSAEAAKEYFWKLMVTGCKGDNVPGIPRKGDKAWEAAREGEYESNVIAMYEAKYHAEWSEMMMEQGNLLHMRRHSGDRWWPYYDYSYGQMPSVPSWPEELGIPLSLRVNHYDE